MYLMRYGIALGSHGTQAARPTGPVFGSDQYPGDQSTHLAVSPTGGHLSPKPRAPIFVIGSIMPR